MIYSKEIVGRVILEAECFVAEECTIREVAKYFNIPKSTMYEDLAVKLPEINWGLYMKVRRILNKNKAEAPYRASKVAIEKRQQKQAG